MFKRYILPLMDSRAGLCQRRFLRDPLTQKKIFFYPSVEKIDKRFIDYIENNGGRRDIIAVSISGMCPVP